MSGIATAIVGSAVIGGGASYLAADRQADAMENAAGISYAAGQEARGDVNNLFDAARRDYTQYSDQSLDILRDPTDSSMFNPYATAGAKALQQQALMANQDPFANFEESEAQKFFREREEQALLRNSAAIGGLGGGNVRTALQEQAVGIAGQQRDQFMAEYQQRFNNYGTLADRGFNATTNIANMSQQDRINLTNALQQRGLTLADLSTNRGTTLANIATGQGSQMANYTAQAGKAEAAGILGIGTSVSNALGDAAMYYGYRNPNPGTPAGSNYYRNQIDANLSNQFPGTIWQS